eukprot:m.706002 g.706002  ORF g.706002 m.706002 type:complete len:81 (+) comp58723_c0_seq92:1549-1791(+)
MWFSKTENQNFSKLLSRTTGLVLKNFTFFELLKLSSVSFFFSSSSLDQVHVRPVCRHNGDRDRAPSQAAGSGFDDSIHRL